MQYDPWCRLELPQLRRAAAQRVFQKAVARTGLNGFDRYRSIIAGLSDDSVADVRDI